jgi:glyoxylase-like metal-dependent hydrolase (beta-lactamase superfamily II)
MVGNVPSDDRLYFRQLLSGRDHARTDPLASQMVNFSYLIGDRETRQALVVDPAYAVEDILGVVAGDGMTLAGVLVTHHHPDHVGGSMMGQRIEGLARLLEVASVPIHAHRQEVMSICRVTGVDPGEVVGHDGGEKVAVGAIEVELIHTPGHTPGSQCFLVDGMLVAGDTLFLSGCGRTDLPGGDPQAMYDSLRKLSALAETTVLYPGHRYSAASAATLDIVKQTNPVLGVADKASWLAAFGG